MASMTELKCNNCGKEVSTTIIDSKTVTCVDCGNNDWNVTRKWNVTKKVDGASNTDETGTAKSNCYYHLIPWESIKALGEIYHEGQVKYGPDGINGVTLTTAIKSGKITNDWITERYNHAIEHLRLWLEGNRDEDHLAKVMWFAATVREIERLREIDTLLLRKIRGEAEKGKEKGKDEDNESNNVGWTLDEFLPEWDCQLKRINVGPDVRSSLLSTARMFIHDYQNWRRANNVNNI